MGGDRGLYLHVPFCTRRCVYCDFAVVTGRENRIADYADALCAEIAWLGARTDRTRLDTIYFGGGTPSKTPDIVLAALDAVGRAFDVATDAEVTVEVNPESATTTVLDDFRAAGVTRVSVGVQTFRDDVLTRLGRLHDAGAARRAVEAARERFAAVSLDLIFGIPETSVDGWLADLDDAAALGVDHLSPYCLTVESGTPLAEAIERHKEPPPDDDLEADQLAAGCERLAALGFERYEISSWAKPGKRCRHNAIYWRRENCLAAGMGASGLWDGTRWTNVRDFDRYLDGVARSDGATFPPGPAAATSERLDPPGALGEAMFLGLRTSDGVDLAIMRDRFGLDPAEVYRDTLARFEAAGYLARDGARVRLTDTGFAYSNQVFCALIAE